MYASDIYSIRIYLALFVPLLSLDVGIKVYPNDEKKVFLACLLVTDNLATYLFDPFAQSCVTIIQGLMRSVEVMLKFVSFLLCE